MRAAILCPMSMTATIRCPIGKFPTISPMSGKPDEMESQSCRLQPPERRPKTTEWLLAPSPEPLPATAVVFPVSVGAFVCGERARVFVSALGAAEPIAHFRPQSLFARSGESAAWDELGEAPLVVLSMPEYFRGVSSASARVRSTSARGWGVERKQFWQIQQVQEQHFMRQFRSPLRTLSQMCTRPLFPVLYLNSRMRGVPSLAERSLVLRSSTRISARTQRAPAVAMTPGLSAEHNDPTSELIFAPFAN